MVIEKELTIEEVKKAFENEFFEIVYENLEEYFDYYYCQTDVDDFDFSFYGQEKHEVSDLEVYDGDCTWYADVDFDAGLDEYLALTYLNATFHAVKIDEEGNKVDAIDFKVKG